MSERVNLRISYGNGLDIVPGEHIGIEANGDDLYRVWRHPLRPGDPERVDVLRLRRLNEYAFEFVGTADPERPGTAHFILARSCLGTPACDAFRQRLDDSGCVMENEWSAGNAIYLVFTHPNDAAVGEWYAQMLRESIGVAPDELRQYLYDQRRATEREQARRKARRAFTGTVSSAMGLIVSVGAKLAVLAVIVGIAGWGGMRLVAAQPAERPRVAAIAMLVTMVPFLLSREGRKMWPLLACCAAAGIGALTLLHRPTPSYGAATALGTLYAVVIGAFAVVLGLLSGLSSSARQMWLAIFGFVLPALASAVAAAALAVTSAVAAGSRGGLAPGARTVAIGLTALFLLAPAAVFVTNAGAVLFERGWRAKPKLQLLTLLTMPLSLLPMLLRVGIPIAVVWAIVWLLGRVGDR